MGVPIDDGDGATLGIESGLELTRANGVSYTIGAGTVFDGAKFVSASEMTKSINAAWTAGDGGGAASTLTLSNNMTIHLFIVRSGGAIDYGYDDDIDGANLAADGLEVIRRLFPFRLAELATSLRLFTISGDVRRGYFVDYVNSASVIVGDHSITTRELLDTQCPVGEPLKVQIRGLCATSAGGAQTHCMFGNPADQDLSPYAAYSIMSPQPESGGRDTNIAVFYTDSSAQMYTRLSAAAGSLSFLALSYEFHP